MNTITLTLTAIKEVYKRAGEHLDAPKMELRRLQRAYDIVRYGKVQIISDHKAIVNSHEVINGECSCEDSRTRGNNYICKHRLALRMYKRAVEVERQYNLEEEMMRVYN